MKKSFMEQIQEFHIDMQLADKAGALDIPASVMDGINPVRLAFDDIVNNAKETAHIHAFWCSDFFMDVPMSKGVMSYMIFNHFAKIYNKPISWFYMIPHQIVLDPAYQKVRIGSDPKWFNEDGSATTVMRAAFEDAKNAGLIDKDEEWVFAVSDGAEDFVNMTKEFISNFANANDISFDEAVDTLTGNKEDFSFPHESDENDDSPQ